MDPRTWVKDLTWYFMFLLFTTTIGPLLFGFHLAELNTPQDVITCKRKSIFDSKPSLSLPQCIPMNPTEIGLVSSIFTAGGLVGALVAGPLSAKFGRLRTMQSTTAFFIAGPAFEALASNIGVMTVGRFISGLGAGAAVVVVPIYVSEVAPPAERGFFGSFTQIMVNVGILIAQLLGFFLSHGQFWRIVLGAGGAIGAVQTVGLLFACESPKWMADRGHPGKAKKTLRKIRGDKFDIEEEISEWGVESREQFAEEEETLLGSENHPANDLPSTPTKKESPNESVSMWGVVRDPLYNRAVVAVIAVMLAQQLTGINSIIMYGVTLLANLLESNSATLNLAVSALNIIVTAIAATLVDRVGRKTCILQSIFGMGVSSLILAIGIGKGIKVLSAVAVICFVASFGLGLGPVPFLLPPELVGPEAVSALQSWALAANWIATFVVAQFFPMVNSWLGGGRVYYIFAGVALFFFLFVGWWLPETRGKKNADEVWGRERRVD
ncbi:vacuolar protein sorting-associated protein 73 [Rhizodiscina lignyota]|uniref:Vacuolar protein sorting-associated protein 73 n=1 Tax=Rhizodiscina lignyota TaxID=1504668 RepID=A0A9P4INH0_9PEZI|nr:vacuolar protein sorting-associated protein 73 [Rhizodiscina lignyota]